MKYREELVKILNNIMKQIKKIDELEMKRIKFEAISLYILSIFKLDDYKVNLLYFKSDFIFIHFLLEIV